MSVRKNLCAVLPFSLSYEPCSAARSFPVVIDLGSRGHWNGLTRHLAFSCASGLDSKG